MSTSDYGQYFSGKAVLVTGGAGFLGSHIVDRLRQVSDCRVAVPRRAEADLTVLSEAERYFSSVSPEVVIHCAAFYGGMKIHTIYPGKIYYENVVMGANVFEAARRAGVKKLVCVLSDCSYPGYLDKEVLSEDDLWKGLPHQSALDYGLAKRLLPIQGWAYKEQYGFNSIHLIPTNMYGLRDHFDPDRSHVVAALVKKFIEAVDAGSSRVEIWGSGRPTRNFLYVDDAAEGILRATVAMDDPAPMNLTNEHGNTVRELAEAVAGAVGFRGELYFNTEKPDGQMKKILDVSRMKNALGWMPSTDLATGLQKTVAWYRENQNLL